MPFERTFREDLEKWEVEACAEHNAKWASRFLTLAHRYKQEVDRLTEELAEVCELIAPDGLPGDVSYSEYLQAERDDLALARRQLSQVYGATPENLVGKRVRIFYAGEEGHSNILVKEQRGSWVFGDGFTSDGKTVPDNWRNIRHNLNAAQSYSVLEDSDA